MNKYSSEIKYITAQPRKQRRRKAGGATTISAAPSSSTPIENFVSLLGDQEIFGLKNFIGGLLVNGAPLTYDPTTKSWLFDGNIIATGGIAARAALGALNAPTIMDALVVDNQKLIIDNGVLTLNPNLDLGGLDTEELEKYLTNNNYATTSDISSALAPYAKATDVANTYATIASLAAVTSRLDDFLSGSDTDTIINKWKELETFLSGLSESDNLATLLSGKADKATTLAGYGITDAYTKAEINTTVNGLNASISDLRTYANNTFVTLATAQPITARHDFTDGLKVGGLPIYKSQDDVIYIEGNLVVRGGITARGTNGTTAPSIYDGLPIDGTSIYWENGVLKSSATSSGGIDETQLKDYLKKNNYATTSDITSALSGYATQSWVTGRGYITGITSSMVTSALGYTPLKKSGDILTIKGNQYTGLYGIDMQNSNIVNLNAIFMSDVANDPTEGIQYKRTNGNFDSIWAADGVMYFSPDGNNAAMTGSYTTNYTVLHSGNYNSYPVRNPYTLSWSGYSSGSYDGSAAKSISLPTKLSQLTDDVVAGKYLPLTGGTVNGDVYSKNYRTDGVVYIQRLRIENDNEINGYTAYNGGSANGNVHLNYASSGIVTLCNGGGYCAIGGTTASERLHVHGDLLLENSGYYFRRNSQSTQAFNTKHGGFIMYDGLVSGEACRFEILNNSGVWINVGWTLFHDGNMTIGVPVNDGARLSVRGNLLVWGGITARYTSDMRLKKNRRGVNASATLMSLGAVQQFEYIDSEVEKNHIYEGTHIGLIYQNVVGTALNRMCHEREDGYGSLNYLEPSFIALLAGVGQEHETRIQQLERENKALKKEVEQLKQRVA